jgi:hypothetical protein
MFRTTTMRRAAAEGAVIFLAGRLLAMVPTAFWPFWLFPAVLVARLVLWLAPPVWAAMRVKSTRREKMSRRFWKLGPQLAMVCALVDAGVALALGDATLWGGAAGPPDAARFFASGAAHVAPVVFVLNEGIVLVVLALFYTLAVVCTRLANGGFMRFTMPAGNGRVTL